MEKKRRPKRTYGPTICQETGCGKLYIRIYKHEEKIVEVFASLGKGGGCANCQLEAITRCITVGLSYGIPIEEYIKQLTDLKCLNQQSDYLINCPNAIAKAIREEL